MKWSDIVNLVDNYQSATWSHAFNETRFGCECCGGDSYTSESWDEMCEAASAGLLEAEKFCKENNIEYDGMELR